MKKSFLRIGCLLLCLSLMLGLLACGKSDSITLEKGKLIAYGDIDPISEQYSKMIGG